MIDSKRIKLRDELVGTLPVPGLLLKNYPNLLWKIHRLLGEEERREALKEMQTVFQELAAVRTHALPPLLALAAVNMALQEEALFVEVIAKAVSLGKRNQQLEQWLKTSQLMRQNKEIQKWTPKVFGIGLSKTATTSLHVFLRLLGLPAAHFHNPITKDLLYRSDFDKFNAFSDISVSYQFESLYHQFPNARFIYTQRALEPWTNSIQKHYKSAFGIDHLKEINRPELNQLYRGRLQEIHYNLYGQCSSWQEAYQAFEQRVDRFFEAKPKEKLLKIDVTQHPNPGKAISSFLGMPDPNLVFPHKNKTNAAL